MKIKPTTLFLVLTALLLGGIALLVAQTPDQTSQEVNSQSQDLFAFTEDQVQAMTLTTQSRTYKFERDQAGKWQIVEPEKTAANDASVAFLLDQLATAKTDRALTITASEKADFGFDQPLATIDITLKNQQTHQLVLGKYDFNRSFIYALADPTTDANADLAVALVSPNFENAVSRPPEEWKVTEIAPEPVAPEPADPETNGTPAEAASPEASPTPSSASPTPDTPQTSP